MDNLGVLLVLLGGVGIWYFIKKQKDDKKRNISIALLVIGFGLVGIFGESSDSNANAGNDSNISSEVVDSTPSSAEIEAAEEEEKARLEAEKKAEEEKAAEEQAAKEREEKERAEEEAREKKEAEEQAKLEAEKKDPATYRTDVSYENIARNPDDYLLEKLSFSGEIIQVIEGDDSSQYRLAVNGDYNNVIFIEIEKELLSTRILEDDYVTIYGNSIGTISYDSTNGGKITVPAMVVNMFEFN